MSKSISICVPFFDNYLDSYTYLFHQIESVRNQSLSSVQYVISYQGSLKFQSELRDVLNCFQNVKIIKSESTGISSNINNAILNADGNIIKILFQDDFLINLFYLNSTIKLYETLPITWACSGSIRYFDSTKSFKYKMIPRFSEPLLKHGVNTISSPSVVSLRKESFIPFNEHLSMFMDCDWYLRMSLEHGRPFIDSSISIANRIHDHQLSNRLDSDTISRELDFFQKENENVN
jgi:hypothetical protein